MKFKTIFCYILIGIILSCQGQKSDKQIQIIDKNTGFKMNLPKGFEELTENESDKVLSDGKKNIDNLYDTDIDISDLKPKIFKIDNNNYFLLNIREYNPEVDGDYSQAVNESNRLLYKTYVKNFENAHIDTLSQKKKIDNIEFTKYSISVKTPRKTEMKVINYTTFIKNKDLTVAVVYTDESIGNEILSAIESIKFEK